MKKVKQDFSIIHLACSQCTKKTHCEQCNQELAESVRRIPGVESAEARIREAFATSLKDSTKIIIAQRISSVIDADKIVVLDDGKITGVGTHEELLRSNREYQEIYYSQTDKKEGA